ncbi:MAG: outer membrane beta-barrel protein [Geminicoccaceae bacterium]
MDSLVVVAETLLKFVGQCLAKGTVCTLSSFIVLAAISSGLGQDATPDGEDPLDVEGPLEAELPADEIGDDKPDPRTILRQERERRERIENLSRAQPNIPQEGAVLAAPNVPPGLLSGSGLRYGKLVFSPRATVGALLTDNANANGNDDNRESDVILGLNTSLRADTLLRRHALGAQGSITSGTSLEGTEDDFLDWQAGVDGRYDLTRQSSLDAAVSGSLFREADRSAAAEGGDDATVNNISAGAGYAFDGRLWDFSLAGVADFEEFTGDDTEERDNVGYTLTTRLAYRLSERTSIFVSPRYTLNEFEGIGDEGQDRDSTELTGVVGMDVQPRPRLSLGGSVGYSQILFDDPNVEENGSVVGALDARYGYDARTTFRLSANREIDVTTVDEAAVETLTEVNTQATRLLTPKHAVTAQAIYANNNFDDGDRVDHDITGVIGYFFRFDQNLIFNLGYQYFTRFSNENNVEFDENQVFIGLTVAY